MQNKEMIVGRIISITNIAIGIIAFLPTVLCFLFTVDAFFRTGSSGTDQFPDPLASTEEKVLFSIASLLLILFYRYIITNPFSSDDKKIIKQVRLQYWLQVIFINLLALALFIYFMGENFFPQQPTPDNAVQLFIYCFIYLPIIPLLISSVGCYYNIKQSRYLPGQTTFSDEN